MRLKFTQAAFVEHGISAMEEFQQFGQMKLISEYEEKAMFYDEFIKEVEQRVKAHKKYLTQLFAIIKEKDGGS